MRLGAGTCTERGTRRGGQAGDIGAERTVAAAAPSAAQPDDRRSARRRRSWLPVFAVIQPLVPLLLCLLLVGESRAEAAGGGWASPTPRPPTTALQEDHAVVAVTVDGHVHTLDAWSGNVRGVYADSGGPLVSSSTTIESSGTGSRGSSGSGEGGDSENRRASCRSGSSSSGSSGGGSASTGAPHQQQHGYHRNALGEGLVVPGLDGVIYSLGADGRLSVLTSSAPDLVLEPRMACLAVNADADGVVEDESCGLLIGEKTTELFSLDTETGTAKRIGGGVQNRPGPGQQAYGGDKCWADAGQGEEDEGQDGAGSPWKWGDGSKTRRQHQEERQPPPSSSSPPISSNSNLLLQRDEYVVRALDAETSEELWFVTVAHFSALDLQGRGGATALTRATVAAADREGYTQAVHARSASSDHLEGPVKALPRPDEAEEATDDLGDLESSGSSSGSWSSRKYLEREVLSGGVDGAGGAGGKQARRRGKFGEEHADRFPYLLYEDNAFVVAIDPIDGSVLWRREMPALAVSLYGIRGREWVDIMPPPMSMLQSPSPAYFPPASAASLMTQSPLDAGSGRSSSSSSSSRGGGYKDDSLAGEEVDWSRHGVNDAGPLLLLNGNAESGLDAEDGSNDEELGVDGFRFDGGGGGGEPSCTDASSFSGANPTEGSTALVPATVKRPPGGRTTGLLQPGVQGQGRLKAQLGFLNGHFFVSSPLRRVPLQGGVADAAAQDRYPHPLGMASRRSFVDAAGRDARERMGDSSGWEKHALPLEAKVSPQAARPVDQVQATVGRKTFITDDRPTAGARVGQARYHAGGGGGGITTMGIGAWRPALLDLLEPELIEEAGGSRAGRNMKAAVEVLPDNKGLFMSWRVLAVLVGGVVAIVAAVAYLAYKHGVTAMATMPTITRRVGAAARLSRNGSPGITAGARSGRKHPLGIVDTPKELALPGQGTPGRLLSPATANSPALQHGASTSDMYVDPRPTCIPPVAGGKGYGSPPEAVFHRSRSMDDVQMQRVHSLPALRQSHSPSAVEGDWWRQSRQQWHSLFGSEDGTPGGGVANGGGGSGGSGIGGGGGHVGRLTRAVSAAVGRAAGPRNGSKFGSSAGSSTTGGGSGAGSAFCSAVPSPRPSNSPALATPPDPVYERGPGSSKVDGSRAEGFRPTTASSAAWPRVSLAMEARSSPSSAAPDTAASSSSSSSPEISDLEEEGGGSKRRGCGSNGSSRGPSSRRESFEGSGNGGGDGGNGSVVGDADEIDSEKRRLRRQQQQQQQRLRRAHARKRTQGFPLDEGGIYKQDAEEDDGGGGSGRSKKSSSVGGTRERGGSRRRASRSPRASITSSVAGDELVLDPRVVGGVGGSGVLNSAAVVGTGGEEKDTLLVTNRRLRTEFVEGEKLGKGGFGTVFKCRNRLDGHDYAVKKIRLSSDPRWQPQLAKVLREVKIMSLLDHPNIVRYYQAWLEKFTEEDEELLRDEGVVSESWDQTTGGCTRASHLHHHHRHRHHHAHPHHQSNGTGSTAGTATENSTRTFKTTRYGGSGSNTSGLRGLGGLEFGPHSPNNPLFVMPQDRGAAAAARGESPHRDIGEGQPWPRAGYDSSALARPLFEEHSIDGWSIDSRNAGDQGGGDGGSGEGGGGRHRAARAWGDISYDEGMYDEEGVEGEEEDDDEASMPGFVFDRGEGSRGTNTRVEEGGEGGGGGQAGEEASGAGESNGWLVSESGDDGCKDGDGGGGGDEHDVQWTQIGEKRPSGSGSATATATASAYSEEREGCGDGVVNAKNICAQPLQPFVSCGREPQAGRERTGVVGPCSNGGGDSDDRCRRGHAGNDDDDDDDDSVSWNRARPMPQGSNGSAAAGSDGHRAPCQELPPLAAATVELELSDVRKDCPTAAEGQGGRRGGRGFHKSDGEGQVAAAAIAAEAAEAEGKGRPRGRSWPFAAASSAAAACAAARTTAAGGNPAPAGRGIGGYTALEERKRRRRSAATAAAFLETATGATGAAAPSRRKNSWKGGLWQTGRAGGGRMAGGRRRSKEVYDLWLYIQMQYCSHDNLQHFLDEDPTRRGKTRVDMPQVMHIFMQVARGLQYVHACGLIHRDLKPANCFLMRDGTVKIGDFGLSRHILPADGINGAAAADDAAAAHAAKSRHLTSSFAWELDHSLAGGMDGDESITGGVGTYLYASPEQMSGQGYDEKTDVYSLGMLLFELCHPPFGTKMERTVVLTNAHRLQFPPGGTWGPSKGQEAMKALCRSMLQEQAGKRPSAADIVRQVELMQGKHMVLQLDKMPAAPFGANDDERGRPDMAIVLRVEALDQEGLLHRLVERIRALCKGQGATAAAGGNEDARRTAGGGARLEQYGLRGHTGSAVMEFLIAGATLEERESIIAALEELSEVKTVREFPANG